ncbi:MAG: DUF262 domain-containing HNH endonuclease family protein [Clostridiales bacterium]|nr:DUF262 domain-containing HNH endonuclease family protein [Clostridiales bacterium]
MKNDNNIEALFQQRYVIDPILQRSYEWELNRVVTLIEDIINNKIVGTNGDVCRYSIGEFLTYKKNDKDNFKYICDGQQRLTTLVLLFANIMHHLPKGSDRRGDLYTLLYKHTGVMETVSVITLKEEDNSILNKILKSGIDNLTKEEKKSHLVRVYNEISDKFTKNMSEEKLYDFCKKINNASYYERECESQEEAIQQFINLNGGHQSISNSRIGISMLFAIYDKMQPNNEIKQLLNELSKMSSKQASEFLCLYIYYRAKEGRDSHIPTTINNLYEKNEDLLNDIVNFYNNIYIKNIEQSHNPFMVQSSLRQIWIDLYTDKYPQMSNVDKMAKDIAYRKCEWGYICNRIKNGGSGEKGVFSGIFENFNNAGSNISQYVTEKLRDKGLYEPVNIINTYKQNKSNRGDDLFKRLLLVVEEEYKQSIDVKETITHCDNPTLEHIHPQNPRENETYQCNDTMTNRFGNKTIIGGVANKSLSNKKFSDKWNDYVKSPYYINSKHLSTYKEWTDESVEDNEKFYFDLLNKHYGLI